MMPAHDGGVDDRETALGHHLRQIAVTEFEAQVPPYPQDDDLTVKVAPHKRQPTPGTQPLPCLQIIAWAKGKGAYYLRQSL